MPRSRNLLAVTTIQAAVKKGLPVALKDGGGLQLRPNGRWVYFFKFKGKEKELWLGEWPDVGLALARERRDAAEAKKKAGINPVEDRHGPKASHPGMTFAEFALHNIDALGPPGASSRKVWLKQMTTKQYLGRMIDLTPNEIGINEVEAALTKHWSRAPTISRQLRARIRRILAAARTKRLITAQVWVNPALYRDVLETIMPRVEHVETPRPSLPWEEVGEFLPVLRAQERKYGPLPDLIEWVMLTAVRIGATAPMAWGEIDLKARTWTVPAFRMKKVYGQQREHVVPLTLAMFRVLRRVWPLGEPPLPGALVFPSGRSATGHFAISGVDRHLKAIRRDICVHGFRSTFSTWAEEETDVGDSVIRMCLAQVKRGKRAEKVLSRYARSDLMRRRRALMRAWTRYCVTPAAGVEALSIAA